MPLTRVNISQAVYFSVEERKWIKGVRGGEYYINELGIKVYKRNQAKKPIRKFRPKRGAFYRHLQSQLDSDGDNLNLC